MAGPSTTEKYNFFNFLTCVVKGLEGHYTVIDLRNEAYAMGKIKYVDGFMNIDLEDVVYYNPMGVKYVFSTFFVKARLIRYVHIPKDILANDISIKQQLDNLTVVRSKKIQTFKVRRAEKYQQEIIQSMSTAK